MMQGKVFCAIMSQSGGPVARGRRGRAGWRFAAALLCGAVLEPSAATADAGLEALSATRERPLFSPNRRPPPPVVAPPPAVVETPPPAELPPPNLQISGIVIGSQQVAIVKHPQDQNTTNVSIGTTIDGWTVSDIGPRSIVLQHDSRNVTIALPDHDQ